MAPIATASASWTGTGNLLVAQRSANRVAWSMAQSRPAVRPARGQVVAVRAERGSGGFASGFVLGGVVCGVLGFVFAPQISRALLGDDQRIRLPRFMEEAELDPEVTKQNLAEKIAQLNEAIDDVSAQLRAQETTSEEATA